MSTQQEIEDAGTARALLDSAGQAVRQFIHLSNMHLTRGETGWESPRDVYDCVGKLQDLVEMLPQAIEQLRRAFAAQHAANPRRFRG